MWSDDHTDKLRALLSVVLPSKNSILHTAEQMKNNRTHFLFYLPGNPLYTACLHASWPRKTKTDLADLKSYH